MQSLAALHPDTFLSGVLDDVGVALVVVDGQDCSTLTNQAARQILGHPERLDGISLEEWRRDYVFRDDQGRPIPTELAPIVRALAGEQVPPQDIDVTLPDGRRKYLHAAGHPFSVFGVTGLFVIITDETEQIKLRRGLERAQNAETLGLVVQGLAHDLKNMISVISGECCLDPGRRKCSGNCADQLEANNAGPRERIFTGDKTCPPQSGTRTTASPGTNQ